MTIGFDRACILLNRENIKSDSTEKQFSWNEVYLLLKEQRRVTIDDTKDSIISAFSQEIWKQGVI